MQIKGGCTVFQARIRSSVDLEGAQFFRHEWHESPATAPFDSCHGRVSGISKICIRSSSYCRSQATAA